MEKLKINSKEKNTAAFVILSILTFLRVSSYLSFDTVGYILGDSADLGKSDVIKPLFFVFLAIIALFSCFTAVFIKKLFVKSNEEAKYIIILFLADFIFFNTQNSLLKLAISAAMLFVSLVIINKPDGNISAALLLIFSFVSCALLSSSLFSYALLIDLFYVLINLNGEKRRKTVVLSFVSLLLAGIGFSLHKFLCKTFELFNSFVTSYTLVDITLKKSEFFYYKDDMYLLLFTIPFVLVFIWFISEYSIAHAANKKANENKALVPILSLSVMAFNFSSFYFAEREVASIIGLVPVFVISALVLGDNVYAKKALCKMNESINKNKLIFAISAIVICLLSLYFILDTVNLEELFINIATSYDI